MEKKIEKPTGALVIEKKAAKELPATEPAKAEAVIPKGKPKKMIAVFEIESEGKSWGKITVKLHHQLAPKTVENFVGLAEGTKEFIESDPSKGKPGEKVKRRFYDGLVFHRVIPDFMIQGGDPKGNGTGGPGYEFGLEIHPSLTKFDHKGILAMANAGPTKNGSQFFITTVPYESLNEKYTIFGEVISGQDLVDKISNVPRGAMDRPKTPVVMKKVSIEREF